VLFCSVFFFGVSVYVSSEVPVLSVELGSRRGLSVLLISIIVVFGSFFFFIGLDHTPSTHVDVVSFDVISFGGGLSGTLTYEAISNIRRIAICFSYLDLKRQNDHEMI